MSEDLRTLLQDLAAGAPPIDHRIGLADTAYAAGCRRRRVRHLEMSAAAALVGIAAVFAGLFVGPSPIAATYGASSGTVVTGHPRAVAHQWPVHDLPTHSGPLAAVVRASGGWQGVSADGHRWHLPFVEVDAEVGPALSPDGRLLAYLPVEPAADSHPRLTIRDLVTGRVTTGAEVGDSESCDCSPAGTALHLLAADETLRFSPDDRYLTVQGLVLDAATGLTLSTLPEPTDGWTTSDELVAISATTTTWYDVKGARVAARSLVLPGAVLPLTLGMTTVSSDGRSIAVAQQQPDRLNTVYRYDLATGRQQGSPMPLGSAYGSPVGYDGDALFLPYTSPSGARSIVDLQPNGSRRTVVRVGRPLDDAGVWAAAALAGPGHTARLLDRVSGGLVAWRAWLFLAVGVAVALVERRVRARRRRLRPPVDPTLARKPWSRRRRWVALAAAVCPVVLLLAVLTPLVFLPLATADLTVSGPPVWWSTSDAAQARLVAYAGDAALDAPARGGQQQGYTVRVTNPTGRRQTVTGVPVALGYGMDGGVSVLTMSTADGPGDRARDLTYGALAAIPPHQARWVRVLWRTGCFEPGSSAGWTTLALVVRVGVITRTETLTLSPGVGVASAPGSAASSVCGEQP